MEITIEHHGDQFNINLHGKPGAEPFLSIKGCRIVEGSKGPFVSYPARKQEGGKWWQHVYGGEKFNEAVLKKAQQAKPVQRPAKASSGFDDMDDSISF